MVVVAVYEEYAIQLDRVLAVSILSEELAVQPRYPSLLEILSAIMA